MDYWMKRQALSQDKITDKNIAQVEAQLRKYYGRSMKKIVGDFEKTYNELLLTISEGKTPTANDLYKLDRYWKMQAQLKDELQKLGDKELILLSNRFEHQYKDVYNHIELEGEKSFTKIDKEMVKQMANEIWCADGKSWSQRVWNNTDKLQQALNDELINCVLTGKKTTDLKHMLMTTFNVAYHRADTLVRTEMAHLQTSAAQDRYKKYGITEVEVLVDQDERTCDECAKLAHKRFPIGGKMPVPAHPNCRCCIVPVIDTSFDQGLDIKERTE